MFAADARADSLPHIYRLENGLPLAPIAPLAPNDKFQYFGGRVISNANIVEVAWGSGTDPTYVMKLEGFYKAILQSSFMDWFTEYDTIGLVGFTDMMPGSNQHIGRGTFEGTVVITPMNQSTMLTDGDIIKELVGQLNANSLPQPKLDANGNVSSLYMVDFPPGTAITLLSIKSCQSFGAYHFTFKYKGLSVPYGVHPDCGYSFDVSTIIHSHELAEAMTDTEVGLVEYNTINPTARPLAWVTPVMNAWQSQEVGDVCQGTSQTIAGYKVQKIWSNYAKGCVAEIPICDPMSMLVPPACRMCNKFDSANACANPTPACATFGPQTGHCVKCTTDYPNACMGDTPFCDDTTNTCAGCLKDSDCPAQKPVCDLATRTCRTCTKDSDCGTAKKCDTAHGTCGECNVDGDCKTGQICVDHACGPAPTPDAGTPMDAGLGAMPVTAGCSCNSSQASPAWPGLFALLLLRRRRR